MPPGRTGMPHAAESNCHLSHLSSLGSRHLPVNSRVPRRHRSRLPAGPLSHSLPRLVPSASSLGDVGTCVYLKTCVYRYRHRYRGTDLACTCVTHDLPTRTRFATRKLPHAMAAHRSNAVFAGAVVRRHSQCLSEQAPGKEFEKVVRARSTYRKELRILQSCVVYI